MQWYEEKKLVNSHYQCIASRFTNSETTHSLRIALCNLILTPHVSKVRVCLSAYQVSSRHQSSLDKCVTSTGSDIARQSLSLDLSLCWIALQQYLKKRVFQINMVFLAEETIPIPQKDINSWIFDEVSYDENQAVSKPTPSVSGIKVVRVS